MTATRASGSGEGTVNDGGPGPRLWSISLQLLAATAGLTAFIAFVGAAMFWIRFDSLDLPADRAVALLPRSDLLAVGAHSLFVPLLIGLAAVYIIFLIGPTADRGKPTPRLWIALGAFVLVGLLVLIFTISSYDVFFEQFAAYGALIVATSLIVVTAIRTTGFAPLGWIVFASFALFAGVLAIVRTSGTPKLEPAAVVLSGPEMRGTSGFLIAETDDDVYLAPLPGSGDLADPFADSDLDRIVEIPRAGIVRLAVRAPAGIAADAAGREQAQTLLQDLRVQLASTSQAPPPPVKTDNPVEAFAPLVNLHSHEAAWPMNVGTFLAHSTLVWNRGAHCSPADVVAVGEAIEQGRLGSGGYRHPANDSATCKERAGAVFDTAQHTRPSDTSGRPAGLPLDQGFALDLATPARVGERHLNQEGPQTVFSGTRIYWERHPEPEAEAAAERITYWLFYGLSQPPGPRQVTSHLVHEGDWERISVLVTPGGEADEWTPISARYHYHDSSRDVPWSAVRTISEGADAATHPVVFSARGSHASYPRAGSYANQLRAGGGTIITVHDEAIACSRCPVWRTWQLLGEATAQPWYGYGGAWGAAGSIPGTTGPLGPSTYKVGGKEAVAQRTIETVRKSPGG
jgi:hypothetical protein